MTSTQSIRVVFMGTSAFAVPSLEALVRQRYRVVAVVTQPPRPAGRGRKVAAPPAMGAAEKHGLPVLTPIKLRSPESVEAVAELQPDLIVVAAYGQLLPRSILDLPRHGCVNVHASLLPRWRGASPISGAILAGDEFTGVTIMVMDPAMDSGPMLAQSRTRVDDIDDTPSLEQRLSRAGAALLLSTLPCYLNGSVRPVPQDESRATYVPIVKKEDGLIDWSRPAEWIWRANRAYRPWPGSYTFWRGRLLKVISCRPESAEFPNEEPGTVVPLGDGRGIGVVTGRGLLRLEEVALEGCRPTGAYSFSLGCRGFVGSRLQPFRSRAAEEGPGADLRGCYE